MEISHSCHTEHGEGSRLLATYEYEIPRPRPRVASTGGKIPTAIPRAGLNYASVYVAEAKDYFTEEGLENETIVIAGPPAIAAVISGEVDFSGAGGSKWQRGGGLQRKR